MIDLREILKEKNTEHYSKFIHIVNNVKKIAPNVRIFFQSYTNHDYQHLENVENNVNLLINEETLANLNEDEIFCLLCAVWLHDIGMIPFDREREEYKNMSNDEKDKFVNEVRKQHNIRSRVYVQNHEKILNLTHLEAKAIGNICEGHRKTNLSKYIDIELNNTVRVSLLAAILRMADECDITKERESELSMEGIDETTKHDHYDIHKIVQKVNIDHKYNRITIISNINEEKDLIILEDRKTKILNELNGVKKFLEKIHINLHDVCLNITCAPELIHRKILLAIAQEKNINSIINDIITEDDVDYEVADLLTRNYIKDPKTITNDPEIFKDIYKMFFKSSIKEFFYTKYVQEMISKNFIKIENIFNVNLTQEELNIRRELIKNSPTAFYLLMFMDDLIDNTKFNINSNQNGSVMFDSIIVFGVFNDMHQYNDKINISVIEKCIVELDIFKEEYVLPGINFYKKLGM